MSFDEYHNQWIEDQKRKYVRTSKVLIVASSICGVVLLVMSYIECLRESYLWMFFDMAAVFLNMDTIRRSLRTLKIWRDIRGVSTPNLNRITRVV